MNPTHNLSPDTSSSDAPQNLFLLFPEILGLGHAVSALLNQAVVAHREGYPLLIIITKADISSRKRMIQVLLDGLTVQNPGYSVYIYNRLGVHTDPITLYPSLRGYFQPRRNERKARKSISNFSGVWWNDNRPKVLSLFLSNIKNDERFTHQELLTVLWETHQKVSSPTILIMETTHVDTLSSGFIRQLSPYHTMLKASSTWIECNGKQKNALQGKMMIGSNFYTFIFDSSHTNELNEFTDYALNRVSIRNKVLNDQFFHALRSIVAQSGPAQWKESAIDGLITNHTKRHKL